MYTVPFTYHDLVEACSQQGCPICNLSQQLIARYLKMLFYESGNDPEIREKIRQRQGFCPQHTWRVVDGRLGSPLAIAIISRDLLRSLTQNQPPKAKGENFFTKIKNQIQTNPWVNHINHWLLSKEPCLACQQQAETEQRILKTFVESADQEAFLEILQNADALCRPHLQQVLIKDISPAAANRITEITISKWGQLEAELATFIQKNDYRFSGEEMGAERDSWKRATAALVGNQQNKDFKT
jgi:hypothetical protein